MTEADWLACLDPKRMLDLLNGKASDRKLRLLGCAGSRHRDWPFLKDQRSQSALLVSERFADGQATEEELAAASVAAFRAAEDVHGAEGADTEAYQASASLLWAVARSPARNGRAGIRGQPALACSLVRELFGNPFRTVALNSSWLTPTVTCLAQAIYDERAFELMPELADALETAGGTNADMLNHCRGPGPHFRGCWVVDLILGKE